MDKGYSGLRRTRKRAHSSKCPCCYSSDEEEENHAITKKEKIKESNHNNGKRTSTRTRKLASDEDDSSAIGIASSPADSVNENRNSKKPQKTVVSEKSKNKGVSRNSTISNQESAKNAGNIAQVSEQGKKQSGKAGKVGSKKNTRSGNKDEIERGIRLVESEHGLKKLSSNELHSTSRKVKKKKKKKNGNSELQTDAGDANKNELEFKDKSLKSKKSAKAKTSTSSKNIGVQKQSSKYIGSSGIVDKGTLSDDTKKPGTKNNNTGKYKQDMSRGKNSKSGVASSGLSWRLSEEKERTIPLESNKHSNASSSIHVKRKIEAFDHLFSELKKCPGFSKITVSSAAETLLKLTADKLKSMLPSMSPKKSMDVDKLATDKLQPSSKAKTSSTLSERKRRRTDPEKSSSVFSAIKTSSCFSSPKKTVPARGEEAKLSQAAEALVSFRANPTILRQEKTEAEVRLGQSTDKDIVNASTQKKSDATQSCVVKSPLETVTTAETLTVPRVIDSVNAPLQSQVAAQPQSTLLMQGALNQAMRFPTSSEANIQQIATIQQSMVNLDQVTSQLNSTATVPTPVVPTVSTPRTASLATAGMSSIMMSPVGVQNIQALLCRPTQPSNLQTPVAAQTSVPPLSAGGNNQQLQPQQPLKGMENVVSCVGSRTATNLLWNIKPATAPVVYLTSPQTLSGVRARNLIPQSEGHVTLPFTAGMGKVQSVGIPKTSLSSTSSGVLNLGKVTFVNQAVPLSVATVTGQRPILPREQRLPSLLPSAPQTASQLPVTTVVGPIPHNIPPIPVGSIPVQFSSLGVNTSLSAQQTTNSNVVMQAPITEVTIAQATVTQAPLVQVACVTTTQPTTVTPVSAKQAVKKFVHERTKSAELKRSSSLNSLTSNECITSTAVPERPQSSTITPPPSQECQSMDQSEKEGVSHQSMEFNLHQAASALLSISSQDVLDMNAAQLGVGEGEDSMDEHDDEVVFTSKGVFRVGDVDVDPKYNRIGREGYACGKCGKIFTSLSYLARHIKRVCPDMSCRKWKCTMCDKAFRHPFGLQQHIYTHTGERPHKCSQCPKAFYSSNDLRRHSRIHSGERPYHCKHCDKSFATTISLKTHTYIHTGEKPHKCPHCPKTFATSSKLGRHIVTHSEQRPFACGHCPKSFNRSGDLRRHNMHVHECREKPFEFVECDTPPSTANNLTEDMTKDLENVTGTGQMRRCSVCKEMFHSSSDLGLHMLSHDAPESPIQDRNV